jgi:UDP-N-acetylmuramate: L-alanyl-gamma-D-glutamyl-meso-diaminopimelate ligase
VAETLLAMRPVAWPGRLVVTFEPRSATACRKIHQQEYARALALADEVVLAPVGRPEIPAKERLDTAAIAAELRDQGIPASSTESLDWTLELLAARVRPGDLVLMMSNGHFGHLDRRLLERLREARG